MSKKLIQFIREIYKCNGNIPLHAPIFIGEEKTLVNQAINSTFVSSVGSFVDQFELDISSYTGSPKSTVTVNGTAALHVALLLSGVSRNDFVITQALTFVATCNAISYCGAHPIFVDINRKTLGLDPICLERWLSEHAYIDNQNICRHKATNNRIRACVPVHTFGHPCDLDGINAVCNRWHLVLIEDAAESLGSLYKGRHTGTVGKYGALSFNGNKIITTGGGGAILSNLQDGLHAKHITTTSKVPHPYLYRHDLLGYNYRMPNINAAMGVAQMKKIDYFINQKRQLAEVYCEFFADSDFQFVCEPDGCKSNYWLNAIICESQKERDNLLALTNHEGISTRPAWALMNSLPMYENCIRGNLENSEYLQHRLLNLPSSVPFL